MASFCRIAAIAACIAVASSAAAQEKRDCAARISRTNLIPCVIDASLSVRVEETSVLAAQSRRTAASPVLPSNPVLALSGARRAAAASGQTTLNWSAELSQEFEIAGQRSSRLRAAEADISAQKRRVVLSKRDAAVAAWTAYFELIAARQEQELSMKLLAASQRMSAVARGKAEKGLVAPVDADVADAATIRVLESKLAADRALTIAGTELGTLIGSETALSAFRVEGELIPLAGVQESSVEIRLSERPETQVLEDERRGFVARAESFRRARIPNPTLSVFAQNDGFDERVYGVGVALPIPLPTPFGRTYAGEIAEADALGHRAEIERARVERDLRLEMASASAELAAHRQAVKTLTPEMTARAESSLRDLGEEVDAGRLTVREALVAEQALIELLQTNLVERKALCLASVRLARALGVALEAGTR